MTILSKHRSLATNLMSTYELGGKSQFQAQGVAILAPLLTWAANFMR